MQDRVPPEKYPMWVKFTLFGGASTRDKAWIYCGLTAVLAVICFGLSFVNQQINWVAAGILGLLLAALYPFAIRWIDRHGDWNAR